MLTSRSRPLSLLAAGALLLTPLAGCGGEDKTEKASAPSTTTATSSPTASTDSPSPTASAPDGTETEGAAAPGERLTKDNLVPSMLAAMRDKKTAHITMELGSSIGAEADVRYSGDRTDMKMSMDMGPSKASVVMVGGTMYLQQTAGGKYQKIDASDPALAGLLDSMSSFGPESSISAMKGAVEKVEYAGTATVEGDKVDKYHVTVDSGSIAGALGAGAGADLPKSVTYDLYVDASHLVRRIEIDVAKQQITMTVSRWGEPVDIEAPPASQIAP